MKSKLRQLEIFVGFALITYIGLMCIFSKPTEASSSLPFEQYVVHPETNVSCLVVARHNYDPSVSCWVKP
jgi:hypothetical protein